VCLLKQLLLKASQMSSIQQLPQILLCRLNLSHSQLDLKPDQFAPRPDQPTGLSVPDSLHLSDRILPEALLLRRVLLQMKDPLKSVAGLLPWAAVVALQELVLRLEPDHLPVPTHSDDLPRISQI